MPIAACEKICPFPQRTPTYYFRENNFVLKNLTVIIWSVTLLLTAPFLIIKGTEGSNKYGSPPKY